MRTVCYEQMLPHEIVAARKEYPLAYLPLGGLEFHGVQNAVGLDALKAHGLCVEAAKGGGGLVFPICWYGEHREIHQVEADAGAGHAERICEKMELPHANFEPGSMGGLTSHEQANLYTDLMTQIFYQIKNLGFQAIYACCGHAPLVLYARYAGVVFGRTTGVPVFVALENNLVEDYPGFKGDHGGKWETSLLMVTHPGLTDLSQLPPRGEPLIGTGGEDPRDASEEYGQEAMDAVVNRMVAIGKLLVENPRSAAMNLTHRPHWWRKILLNPDESVIV